MVFRRISIITLNCNDDDISWCKCEYNQVIFPHWISKGMSSADVNCNKLDLIRWMYVRCILTLSIYNNQRNTRIIYQLFKYSMKFDILQFSNFLAHWKYDYLNHKPQNKKPLSYFVDNKRSRKVIRLGHLSANSKDVLDYVLRHHLCFISLYE